MTTINGASVAAEIAAVQQRITDLAVSNRSEPVDETEWIAVIRAARLSQHLTQAEVALRMDSSQSMVSSIEKGTRIPSIPMLTRYAAAVGYQLDITLKPLVGASA